MPLSLLIFLPVFLLLFSAVGIAILQYFRPSVGYAWLWASTAALLGLAGLVFLRFRLPLEWQANRWQPFSTGSTPPIFHLDEVSWPYALSLMALLLAVFWTDSARLEAEAGPRNWIMSLLATALGMLAVMANSPLALVLTWTIVDLLELAVALSIGVGRQYSEQTVITFSVRVSGTLLVLVAVLVGSAMGTPLILESIPSSLAVILLLAVGLRLGVLPLNLPYARELYVWRGFGNLLRMVGPSSSLMVLGRLPADAVPESWRSFFLFLTALAALYGAAMWLASDPSFSGRPYWLVAVSALAVGSAVRGDAQASIAWGVALLLSGSVLFLYTAQRRQIMFIPLLGLLGIAGPPFTPAAIGWRGLLQLPVDGFDLLLLLAMLLLLWGYLRRIFVPHEELYRMERWVHTVYPAGLLLLVLAQVFVALMTWPNGLLPPVWWAPLIVTLLALVGGSLAYTRREALSMESIRARWLMVFAQRAGGFLAVFFRLDWLYRFGAWVYAGVQSVVQLLTAILEGDGGVLWAMVLLALLISMITLGGSP